MSQTVHNFSPLATSSKDDGFWKNLEQLLLWKRRHLPTLSMPQGIDVLIWLLQAQNKRKPLKDLYRSSRFSEPTIRSVLRVLAEQGFVSFEANGNDMRVRFVRISPKLEESRQRICRADLPVRPLGRLDWRLRSFCCGIS
jgi:DNA-binding MarR family transcriptional regulator